MIGYFHHSYGRITTQPNDTERGYFPIQHPIEIGAERLKQCLVGRNVQYLERPHSFFVGIQQKFIPKYALELRYEDSKREEMERSGIHECL